MKTIMTSLFAGLLISAAATVFAQDLEQQSLEQLPADEQQQAVQLEQTMHARERAAQRRALARQQQHATRMLRVRNDEDRREHSARVQEAYQRAREELREAAHKVAELSADMSPARGYAFRFLTNAKRAMLGVSIANDEDAPGVRVKSVSPGGPADEAGLHANDMLLAINAVRLDDASLESPVEKVFAVMSELEPGDKIDLEYQRDGVLKKATVVAERRPPHAFAPLAPMAPIPPGAPSFGAHPGQWMQAWHGGFSSGLELVNLNPDLGHYFGASEGLLVVSVPENFPAEVHGGDVLLAIDGRQPADPQHAFRILRSYQTGETMTLEILRDRETLDISFAVPENDYPLSSLSMLKGHDVFQVPGGLQNLNLDNIRIKGLEGLQDLNLEDLESLHIIKALPEALGKDFETLIQDGFINGLHFEFITDDEALPIEEDDVEWIKQEDAQEPII